MGIKEEWLGCFCCTEMVLIPGFIVTLSEARLDSAILYGFHELRIQDPSIDQINAVRNFVVGNDVLVCPPAGAGKSLCYAVLPAVCSTR